MKLVKNYKEAWKFFSVQCSVIGTAISGTYAVMFQQLKDTIEPSTMATITAAVFIAGILGRITSQGFDNE